MLFHWHPDGWLWSCLWSRIGGIFTAERFAMQFKKTWTFSLHLAKGSEEKFLAEWDKCRAHPQGVGSCSRWYGSNRSKQHLQYVVKHIYGIFSIYEAYCCMNFVFTVYASTSRHLHSSYASFTISYSCFMCRHQGRDILAQRYQSVSRCAWRLAAPSLIERAWCCALCCCWTWAAVFCEAHSRMLHAWHGISVCGWLKPPTNIRHQTTRNICLHTSGTLGTCEFNKGSEVPGYVIVLSTTVSPGMLSQPRKMCLFSFFRTDNAFYQCFSSKIMKGMMGVDDQYLLKP